MILLILYELDQVLLQENKRSLGRPAFAVRTSVENDVETLGALAILVQSVAA